MKIQNAKDTAGSGTDIVKVGKQVEKCLDEPSTERLPVGMECHKVFFQPDQVTTSSLTMFVINLIESVPVVVAILMLAMGLQERTDDRN